ncbi:MAG TPA: hypothetical protein PL039_04090 [Kiritimatiellia bacterium]|jgi:hypothetical protein|nr:hypothetical protein [Lentisphaerota bacterium]HPC19364.1 hypothetical protein [Kiritimatiellia bacterium]HQQ60913.1 hypothetical protein [Kiritimatiellia bacterium]
MNETTGTAAGAAFIVSSPPLTSAGNDQAFDVSALNDIERPIAVKDVVGIAIGHHHFAATCLNPCYILSAAVLHQSQSPDQDGRKSHLGGRSSADLKMNSFHA